MKKQTLLALAIASLASVPAHAAPAKNVIFFLGDGMGPTTVTASRIFKYGEDGQLQMEKLPRTARIKTFSNDAQTTDSAPSMAAYMTGVKMNNDVISMSSDTKTFAPGKDANGNKTINNCPASGNGTSVPTLLEQAIAAGKATGVVTTARLTHATPAATYAHICNRDAEYAIAAQAVPGGAGYNTALGNGVDVLLGGVSYYWKPYVSGDPVYKFGRADGRNLVTEMAGKGYTVVNDLNTLNAVTSGRVLGLFDQAYTQGHMSYELDRNPANEPSLSQMTAKAIDLLSARSNGYFLMIEGGRIDHALHGTNAKRALVDTIAFDDAIKTALGKVDLGNTLIVVTADHDHTMTINGYGKRGTPILGINKRYQDGTPSTDAAGNTYTTLVFGNGANRPNVRANVDDTVAQGDNYLQEVGVRLGGPGSETHGGGDVMLWATGAGATTFKGTLDNTKVNALVKGAVGF